MRKEILIGVKNGGALVAMLETEDAWHKPEEWYFAITGNHYGLPLFREKTGLQWARDALDGLDYMYEDLKERDQLPRTRGGHRMSFAQWKAHMLREYGWEEWAGDVYDVGDDGLYTEIFACGCLHDEYTDGGNWDDLKLTPFELHAINASVNGKTSLHLKKLADFTDEDKALYARVLAIFEKYPAFDFDQLLQYATP